MEPTISSLFLSAEEGDRPAADALFTALYAELHRMARRRLARDGPDLTMGTTTLLHEAYLDMAGRERDFPDEGRFMAYASRVMRALVIDHIRERQALKRGAGFQITALETDAGLPQAASRDLTRLGDAVDALADVDPLLAQVVDLRFFCGFTFAEIGAMRGLSERTVQRHWEKARLFLHEAIDDAAS